MKSSLLSAPRELSDILLFMDQPTGKHCPLIEGYGAHSKTRAERCLNLLIKVINLYFEEICQLHPII